MCSSESSDQPEETAAPDPPPPAPVTHIQDRDPVPEEQVLCVCVCVLLSMRNISICIISSVKESFIINAINISNMIYTHTYTFSRLVTAVS